VWTTGLTVTLKNDKEFIVKTSGPPNAEYYLRVVDCNDGDDGAEKWVDAIEDVFSPDFLPDLSAF
jgi:hypothetical protein